MPVGLAKEREREKGEGGMKAIGNNDDKGSGYRFMYKCSNTAACANDGAALSIGSGKSGGILLLL